MSQKPVISIVVTVYNHERYVRRCIESIAMQRCTYPFEVLIGEDCSPDGSRAVLKELQKDLPDNFHFFYREHNMGDQGDGNSGDLLARCQGKYLAILEGDDFWTYDRKLQRQADFLETHPDYVACFHHCTVVGEDSEPNGERYPDCLDEDYSYREYFLSTMPGQTGTFMARRVPYEREKARFNELRLFESYATDRRNAFILLSLGKVRCFQEAWSAYRHIVSGGTSHSSTFSYSRDFARNEVLFGKTLVAYAERCGDERARRTALETYFRMRLRWCHGRYKVDSLGDIVRDAFRQERPLSLLVTPIRWYGTLALRMLRGRSVTL